MNILFVGDIVSKPGREALALYLPKIKAQYAIDFTIVNGENAAHGKGISPRIYQQLVDLGVDAITMGNHFMSKSLPTGFYESATKMIRPLNIHPSAAGCGSRVFDCQGTPIRVTNLLGRAYMNELEPTNPFDALESLLTQANEPIHIVDFHGEATGEKNAFCWYFDGKVSAILGTHTHVQTADERIFPLQTAFISDVGMTGPYNGVIGAKIENMIQRAKTNLGAKYEVADGQGQLNAVVLNIDKKSGKALSITRLFMKPEEA
jgi:metallophosphoesterase (TIGR00282 family)